MKKKPYIKVSLLVLLFLLFVSWHLKIIFLYLIFLVLRPWIPNYTENKRLINRSAFALFLLSFFVLYPDRSADKDDYIQSVYFDKKSGEEVGQPLMAYATNIVGEGEVMTAVSLGAYLVPDRYLNKSAVSDVIRYCKSTWFVNNIFHVKYRNLARKGLPTHATPYQLMQGSGFYRDVSHYFLHVPKDKNPEDCEVVVFCHGMAGNWQMYPTLFAEYTDAIVIAVETPNFSGYFTSKDMKYIVNHTIPHAFKRMGIPYKKPHIVGLSNGGSAINNAAAYYPNSFKSYTILSAGLKITPRTKKKVHVIYGSNDRSGWINSKIPKSKYVLHRIKGADHSLLVARTDTTFALINRIINE